MNVGTHLRETRERRGLTLRQLADSTKLSVATLQHIERNEFSRLPGGILTRGSLRAYAAEVGVDAEDIVREYLIQVPAGATEELPVVRKAIIEPTHLGRQLVLMVIGIVIAVVAYNGLHDRAGSPLISPLDPLQVLAPIEPSANADADQGAQSDEGAVRLEIRPTGACWIAAIADGRLMVYRLLQSGERVTVVADDHVVLRVGDPETFEYSLNGTPGRALGDAGRPVTVTITQKNMQTFLAVPPSDGADVSDVS